MTVQPLIVVFLSIRDPLIWISKFVDRFLKLIDVSLTVRSKPTVLTWPKNVLK